MSRRAIPQAVTRPQVDEALTSTGHQIAQARKARDWTMAELGERLGGVDRRTVAAMESGEPGVGFGLVVATLWLLDLPLLATLEQTRNETGRADASGVRALWGHLIDMSRKVSAPHVVGGIANHRATQAKAQGTAKARALDTVKTQTTHADSKLRGGRFSAGATKKNRKRTKKTDERFNNDF